MIAIVPRVARPVAVVAAVAAGALLAWSRPSAPAPPPLRFATFNIEEFPKDARQIAGAFEEIAALDVGFVAVQEILEPETFAFEAAARLGSRWAFVAADAMPLTHARMHLGVLYDRGLFDLVGAKVHDDTRLEDGRHKPTFEVRLAPLAGGPELRVFVVHLKAGADGRDLRARQYDALGGLLERAVGEGGRVIVLGDFNATDDLGDRADLAALAARTGLRWATEALACSAFWDRADGCPTSRLDHVLTWAAPTEVAAHGACADGCALRDRCPLYAEQVSDHCPVSVQLP